ncbi:PLP-dependent aminotransferase family protein [Verminephrobacter aporrectodeae subsp. tuberculatae]|nr:PLP-dependent aminotransferase family protein [Verminephrobacter aporrectodeae subsp. tuberculatae]MCW8203125.1 PLP-dependent aminotransferase family protein [Verminephrobacter aporrectodeae subsp. tuberculatae]
MRAATRAISTSSAAPRRWQCTNSWPWRRTRTHSQQSAPRKQAAMVKRSRGMLLQSIVLDRGAAQTLSTQIYRKLKDLLLDGSLSAGDRLPSTRTMASELGVARATIVETFERLVAEGLLESRVGAGTHVSPALNARVAPTDAPLDIGSVASAKLAKAIALAGQFGTRLVHQHQPFTTGMPAFDAFPMAQWFRLSSKHWRNARKPMLSYPEPHGELRLREAIATHLRVNRGIACHARQIFIVGGAQYAFQLIAEMLIDAGDRVWFENPGHIGARNCFMLAGAHMVAVPVDEAGLRVEQGRAVAPSFKLAFVTPSQQQPLGVKMSLDRRFALLQAAEAADAWIIEDDWAGDFCVTDKPLPTLKELDLGGRVIYVGSFSKSIFPALRLGFILAPPPLVPFFCTSLEAFSPGVPTHLQTVLAEFIAEGHFATHVRRMRRLYAERYDALAHAVGTHLARWLELAPTRTGLHTFARLKCPIIDRDEHIVDGKKMVDFSSS